MHVRVCVYVCIHTHIDTHTCAYLCDHNSHAYIHSPITAAICSGSNTYAQVMFEFPSKCRARLTVNHTRRTWDEENVCMYVCMYVCMCAHIGLL